MQKKRKITMERKSEKKEQQVSNNEDEHCLLVLFL